MKQISNERQNNILLTQLVDICANDISFDFWAQTYCYLNLSRNDW